MYLFYKIHLNIFLPSTPISYLLFGEAYTGYCWGNLWERDHLGDPGVDGRIILRWIFGIYIYISYLIAFQVYLLFLFNELT